MKKNIGFKYFLVFIFFVLHSFNVSTSVEERNFIEENIVEEDGEEMALAYYPEAATRAVHHKLDSLLNRFNKRYDFHGSVLVAKKGKVVFKHHYGYADFKEKTTLDNESVFQLASVSKQFTAAAVLMLKDRGQLELDDKVTTYFPDFPYEEITVRHLLNHTSGLPKYFWLAEHKWQEETPPTNEDMLALMAKENLPLYFRPGSRFDYSNTGYFVLASIVEKVAGEEYGAYLQDHIFEPLGMKHSFVYRYSQDSVQEGQLDGYRLYRRRWHARIPGTVNDAIVGDKNVYSTTEDMLKWINALNSGRVVSQASLNEMYTCGETVRQRKVPYGFGFRIQEEEQDRVIYHNGRWNGFSTSLMQYPEDDLVVITLEHSNYNSMKLLNSQVRAIVNENFVDGSS